MNSKFVLAIFLITCMKFSLSAKTESSTDANCDKNTIKRIDDLVSRLTTYGNSGRKFPETAEEIPKYCNDTKTILDSIEKLNKNCTKGLAKNILSVGMYTITKRLKKGCGKTSDVTNTNFESAKCVNKASNLISKCFTKGIDNLLGIQSAEEKKKIPMACCEVTKLKDCIIRIKDKVSICTEEHMELTTRFIDSIIGNSLSFACADYNSETDKCSALKPPKKRKNQRRTRSMIVAFLQLFETFPEDSKKVE